MAEDAYREFRWMKIQQEIISGRLVQMQLCGYQMKSIIESEIDEFDVHFASILTLNIIGLWLNFRHMLNSYEMCLELK